MPAAVKNNFQEYDPRHRLTGAVVLILLAIILLPMLLTKNQDEQVTEIEPVVMEVTKEGKKIFVSRITSVTPNQESTPAVAKKSNKAVPASESKKSQGDDQVTSALFKPMSQKTVVKPTTQKTKSATTSKQPAAKKAVSKPVASKSAKTSRPTAAVSSGWILQVGVFSQSANAKKKVSELKKLGFNAKYGKVKTSKGLATKVWIGPFKQRSSAESMQTRLQHKTRQRGMVVKK